jgi:cytochrome d ubiquinol oxidase subunit II
VLFAGAQLATLAVAWLAQGASASQRWPATVALVVLSWCAIAWTLQRLRAARSSVIPFLSALSSVVFAAFAFFASVWPMIVPPRVSIATAGTGEGAPALLLAGVAIVVPIVLAYSSYAYYVFRGPSSAESGYG